MTTTHLTPFGRPALELLARLVDEAKAGDPLAPVTVLLPDNVSVLTLRRFLAARPGGVAGLTVTTLARLAEQTAASLLAPRRPGTSAVLAAHWRRALAHEPGSLAEVAEHPATVRAMVRASRELREVSDERLDAVAATGSVTSDVVRLHRAVHTRLAAAFYDSHDLLRTAARQVSVAGHVLLLAAGRLTDPEVSLVSALAATGGLEVVAAVTRVRRADEPVLDSLVAAGIDVPAVPSGITRPVAAHLLDASDSDDEVRAVVRAVSERLADVPAHRVAVLHPGAEPYARLLHERFAQAGLKVNGTGVQTVSERAVPRAFLGLLRLPELRFARAEVVRVLGEAPVRLGSEVVPLARWDRLARRAGVVEGVDWDERLAHLASELRQEADLLEEGTRVGEERGEVDLERAARRRAEAELTHGMRTAVTGLADTLAAGAGLTTWEELTDWLEATFDATFGDPGALRSVPPAEQYAVVALRTAIAGLRGLGAVEDTTDLATAIDVLQVQLDAAVPRVGRFGDGVYVGSLGEAALLDVDVVHVVGLAEDTCPGRVREDALLPEPAREAGGLEPLRARVDDVHRAVLASFASAPAAVASFPRGDLRRSTHRLPSRFLLPSLRDLTGDHTLAASDWELLPAARRTSAASFATALLTTPVPADEQEWRVQAAAAGELADPIVEDARAMLAARHSTDLTRFDGNLLKARAGLPDYASGTTVVAPTTLEQLADCPHAFFVQRVLGVRPLEAPEEIVEPPAHEIGDLVHRCFDRLVRESLVLPADGEPWSPADRDRMLAVFEQEADRATARGATGHPRLWEIERAALRRDLLLMLDDDDTWRAENGATVLASELAFGHGGSDAVEVPLARGVVRMRGSADRVDRFADGTVVVTDLKTGSTSTFAGLQEDPVARGRKLQLPAYAAAALGRFGGEGVAAGYWFARRDRQNRRGAGAGHRIQVALDEGVQRTYADAVGVLVDAVAHGVFPAVAPEQPDFAWIQCAYCNPDGLGHGEVRERWERKRLDPSLRTFVALTDPEVLAPGGPGEQDPPDESGASGSMAERGA